MAKAKVKLTYSVECFVEGKDEDEILDWLNFFTPTQVAEKVRDVGGYVTEDYDEQIICMVRDDSIVDYVIKDGN